MERPTQADVARLAGVSRATVSYVVNDRAKDDISITEETRQRVLRELPRGDRYRGTQLRSRCYPAYDPSP